MKTAQECKCFEGIEKILRTHLKHIEEGHTRTKDLEEYLERSIDEITKPIDEPFQELRETLSNALHQLEGLSK